MANETLHSNQGLFFIDPNLAGLLSDRHEKRASLGGGNLRGPSGRSEAVLAMAPQGKKSYRKVYRFYMFCLFFNIALMPLCHETYTWKTMEGLIRVK